IKGGGFSMWKSCYYLVVVILFAAVGLLTHPHSNMAADKEQSIIIEVDGDVEQRAEFVKNHFPYIDVMATFDTLFQGIALKAPVEKLHKIASRDFIQSIHPVRHYTLPNPG